MKTKSGYWETLLKRLEMDVHGQQNNKLIVENIRSR